MKSSLKKIVSCFQYSAELGQEPSAVGSKRSVTFQAHFWINKYDYERKINSSRESHLASHSNYKHKF